MALFTTSKTTNAFTNSRNVALAADAIKELRSYLEHARAKVGTSWDLFAGNAKSTNNGLLDALSKRIDSLETTTLQRLTKGEITFEIWSTYAQEIHRGIASVIQEVDNWSASGAGEWVVKESVADVKDAAANAAKFGLPVIALVAVAVIAVAFPWRSVLGAK